MKAISRTASGAGPVEDLPTAAMEDFAMQRQSLAKAKSRMTQAPAVPVRVNTDAPFASKPGVLRGESTLIIKTHLAQQMVFGRAASKDPDGKRGIIGLIGFAGMLKQIYTGARLDDPYADKWLLDVETAIDRAAQELAGLRADVDRRLAQRPDIQHKVAQSAKPLEVPLFFSGQLPFRAAYLINDFDNLVCVILTAKHVAVLTTVEGNSLIRQGNKAVRRALTSASGYKFTGVSRADIVHGTAKAKVPVERWGELPLAVLDGTRRAKYGPELPAKSYAPQIAAETRR